MLMHQLLLDGAARRPDAPCLRWTDRERALDYQGAVAAMEAAAGALAEVGVQAGDRVTIFAHNGLDYVVSMLGCWRLGAIAALVNVNFIDELDGYLGDHTPTAVVLTHDALGPVRAAAAKLPGVRALLCMDGAMEGALSLPEMMAARLPVPPDPWDETAVAHLSYTSGTTGRPKGACLAHEPTVRACRCIAERLRLRAGDVSLGPTALSSSYQLVGNLLPALAVGASAHVMTRWSPAAGWEALEAAGANMIVGNPVLLADLLAEARHRGRPPAGLRLALTGGAPLPPQLKAAWRDELGLPIVESYGQSELGGFVALGFPELVPEGGDLRRIGPPPPDKEVRIAGPDGWALPPGEVGEVQLRGGFMAGYFGRPEATAEATAGGWLRTGDLGLIDADGHVTLHGRIAEVIDVDGVRWFPRDVEEALGAVPGVAMAALVGLPEASGRTRPVAFVTLLPEADHGPETLAAALEGRTPHDPAAMEVRILPALPMTPTGKISKARLRAMAAP